METLIPEVTFLFILRMQQFEDNLIAEEFAQAKYYERKHPILGSSRPFIEPKLQPQPHTPTSRGEASRLALDNLSVGSVRSAPTLTRSASGISVSGGHGCASPPTTRPTKLRKWPRGHHHYRLSSSASTSSLSSNASSLPRPKSYVPFEGWVETPPPPPGWAARDILHSLSYAPTHDSFSEATQQLNSDFEEDEITSERSSRVILKNGNILPCIPQSPKLKTKSSSFASLMCHQVPDETTSAMTFNFSASIHQNIIMPVLYVHTENEPIYAPTHPLNHPENEAIFNKHPPVIYPPPDLVPASTFRPRSPALTVQTLNSPPILTRHSSTSIGSPGLSSASSSGFETARSSSSSMSSIMFESHIGGLTTSSNNPNVLECIKEASPMTTSSRF